MSPTAITTLWAVNCCSGSWYRLVAKPYCLWVHGQHWIMDAPAFFSLVTVFYNKSSKNGHMNRENKMTETTAFFHPKQRFLRTAITEGTFCCGGDTTFTLQQLEWSVPLKFSYIIRQNLFIGSHIQGNIIDLSWNDPSRCGGTEFSTADTKIILNCWTLK